MAQIRLIPSSYSFSNTQYLTISSASNMYANTDSTTYATIQNTRSSTSSYYLYIKGFNFNSIPDDAIVSDFTVKLKAYHSGGNTSTNYLCNDTTTLTGCTASALSTSATTYSFTCGLDFDIIKGYGNDFGIRINCRRSNRNTASYIYVYGAEIDVTYSLPVYHSITSSTSTGTISPSGTTQVVEGSDYTLVISATNPEITDNGVNKTSSLVQLTGGTDTLIPYDSTSSGFSISNLSNAYTDINGTGYADCSLAGRTTGELYLELGPLTLPSNATITNVSCQLCYQVSRNGSSSSMTASCQLYSGNNEKGTSYTIVSSATDIAKTTDTISTGTWTANEISNARLYITMYNGASSTVRHIYVYGVSFTVTYTISGDVYTYTINNVMADHTLVVSAGVSSNTIYYKVNGSWVAAVAVYKKVNGSWVLQTNLANVFDSNTNYVKG